MVLDSGMIIIELVETCTCDAQARLLTQSTVYKKYGIVQVVPPKSPRKIPTTMVSQGFHRQNPLDRSKRGCRWVVLDNLHLSAPGNNHEVVVGRWAGGVFYAFTEQRCRKWDGLNWVFLEPIETANVQRVAVRCCAGAGTSF